MIKPQLWKDTPPSHSTLTDLIVVIKICSGFGYDLPINETDASSIAAGFAVLIEHFSLYATSDGGTTPCASLCSPTASSLDSPQPTAMTAKPAEPFNAEARILTAGRSASSAGSEQTRVCRLASAVDVAEGAFICTPSWWCCDCSGGGGALRCQGFP